jgi:hypothetical protein
MYTFAADSWDIGSHWSAQEIGGAYFHVVPWGSRGKPEILPAINCAGPLCRGVGLRYAQAGVLNRGIMASRMEKVFEAEMDY